MSYVVELNFVYIFQSLNTASESYKKIYWFSWKCFQVFEEEKNLQNLFLIKLSGCRRRQRWSGFQLRVPDNDLDRHGRPEAARAARPLPAGGGEGEDLRQDGRERGRLHRLRRVAQLLP